MLEKLKNKSSLALFLVVILSLFSFFVFNQRKQENELTEEVSLEFDLATETVTETEKSDLPEVVIVDVKGEVKQPGIYEVNSDMRVNDVINLAEGLTSEADQDQLNLAQKVMDEMIIHVPSVSNESNPLVSNEVASTADKIRLNQATVEDLVTLTGIGPSKAEAIISYRDEAGSFKDVDDLLNVSGIGEKTLEAIRDELQAP